MIDRSHDLPIRRQAELANISRGSAYYKARPVSDGDLELMRRVDELHLELPFAERACCAICCGEKVSPWAAST